MLDNETGRFLHQMSVIRKELNRANRFYAQLSDFASSLLEEAEDLFGSHSKKRLGHFLRKVESLQGETRLLHEYATQISSEYQAQVDIAQNRVMKVLTIVTAIFLPLTLIAGWYGMNFTGMPLLEWRYRLSGGGGCVGAGGGGAGLVLQAEKVVLTAKPLLRIAWSAPHEITHRSIGKRVQ